MQRLCWSRTQTFINGNRTGKPRRPRIWISIISIWKGNSKLLNRKTWIWPSKMGLLSPIRPDCRIKSWKLWRSSLNRPKRWKRRGKGSECRGILLWSRLKKSQRSWIAFWIWVRRKCRIFKWILGKWREDRLGNWEDWVHLWSIRRRPKIWRYCGIIWLWWECLEETHLCLFDQENEINYRLMPQDRSNWPMQTVCASQVKGQWPQLEARNLRNPLWIHNLLIKTLRLLESLHLSSTQSSLD